MLDASTTPDRLNRLVDWLWDLDAETDEDNDGDATNDGSWSSSKSTSATWNQPGSYTVTVHVRDVDGRTAMAQHQVSVTDVVAPTAQISSLGAEQPVDDGYRLDPEAVLRLSCASSTDDHRVDVCAWAIDGAPAGQNTTMVASWSDAGEHTVRLTVSDPSGNTDVLERRVVVVDRTAPRLSATSVSALPVSVTEGATTVVRVSVDDPVDAAETLRVHWDLNPLSDSDGNGVPDDDADFLGEEAQLTFDSVGERAVVITVFDPAGNTDRAVWNVEVSAALSTSGLGGFIAAGVGLLVVAVAAVVVLRLRRTRPMEQEAAPAPTAEETAEQAKAAEMASIYGSAQPEGVTAQPVMAPAYSSPAPAVTLDPMAHALLDDNAAQDAASMAGLEALVEEAESEPVAVFEPDEVAEAPPAPHEPDAPEAPSSGTASAGGRLELPAGLVDMLEEQTDGPQ